MDGDGTKQEQTKPGKVPRAGKSLVFADDNRSLLDTVNHLLGPAGYEVLGARTGLEALCLVAERHPDFLFVDKACAGLDGYELCALLKEREEYRALAVVLLSDGADLSELVKARELGARGILQKPFGRTELLAFLEAETADAA